MPKSPHLLSSFLANMSYEAADTGLRGVRGLLGMTSSPPPGSKGSSELGWLVRTSVAEGPGDVGPGSCNPTAWLWGPLGCGPLHGLPPSMMHEGGAPPLDSHLFSQCEGRALGMCPPCEFPRCPSESRSPQLYSPSRAPRVITT